MRQEAHSLGIDVQVVFAQPQHYHAIGELLVHSFVTQYQRLMPEVEVTQERQRILRDVATKAAQATVWAALVDQTVVGTVSMWMPGAPGSESFLPHAANIRHLAVHVEYFGKGIADLLMDAAEAYAKTKRIQELCLHVRRGAAGVLNFYARRGYVRMVEADLDHLPEVYLLGMRKRL
jgi:ribosomal protein S18 acetylase RimI-like enzyme